MIWVTSRDGIQERFYRENASAIFGRPLQKIRVMDKGELLERVNAIKVLEDEEGQERTALDLAHEAVNRQTA